MRTHSRRLDCCRAAALLLGVWLMFAAGAGAQESDRPRPAPSDPNAVQVDRRLYVPAEDLNVVIERDRRGVMLTRGEFESLVAKAGERTAPAPLSQILGAAAVEGRVEGDHLRLTLKTTLHQLVPGWHLWTIAPMTRLAVESARLDDGPADIHRDEQGNLRLASLGEGEHVLTLELSTELATVGGDQVAAFSLPPSPSATLTIEAPAKKQLYFGNTLIGRAAPLDQPNRYTVNFGGQTDLRLRLTDRSQGQLSEGLTFATTGYGLLVAPSEVTWHSVTTLQVYGKPLDVLELSVPNTLEIADVESPGLSAWELSDDEAAGGTRIRLSYSQPFQGQRKIQLRGVIPTKEDEPWVVPALKVGGVASHLGQIIIRYPSTLRLRVEETAGVRRSEAGDGSPQPANEIVIPAGGESLAGLRFDTWREEFVLRVSTQPKEREISAAIAAVLNVTASGLDLDASLTVETRFAPLFEVDVRLPAEYLVLSVKSAQDGQPLPWELVPQEAGVHLVRVTLRQPLPPGQFAQLLLQAHRDVEGWPVESKPVDAAIPQIAVGQAGVTELALVVRSDDDLDVVAQNISKLDPQPLQGEAERLRFQTQQTDFDGTLRIRRKPTRWSSQTFTAFRVDPQTVFTHIEADVVVQGGGIRALEVTLPEGVDPGVQFAVAGSAHRIIEQKAGAVASGRRTWQLRFEQRVRGTVRLVVEFEQPRAAGAPLTVPELRITGAEPQNGFVAVEAGPEQQLTISATAGANDPLREVDPLDLPPVNYRPQERVIGIYQFVNPGHQITVAEKRFDRMPVPTAVCNRLQLQTLVGETGVLQNTAHFQLAAVGVQGLLLRLPEGASLWAVVVDGQPVEVRQATAGHLIPFTSTGSGQTTRELRVFYETAVEPLSRFGRLVQQPPALEAVTGAASGAGAGGEKTQPIEVLDQVWDLYHTEGTLIVRNRGPLEPVQRLDHAGGLWNWRHYFRVPRLSDVVATTVVIAMAVLLVGLPWVVYRRTGWRGCLFAGSLGGVALLIVTCGLSYLATRPRYENSAARAVASSLQGIEGASSDAAPMAGDMLWEETSGTSTIVAPQRDSGLRWSDVTNATAAPAAADPVAGPAPQAPVAEAPKPASAGVEAGTALGVADRELGRYKENGERELQESLAAGIHLGRGEGAGDKSELAKRPGKPGGKLSLVLDWQAPADSTVRQFRYLGSAASVALDVSYLSSRAGWTLRTFLTLLILLAAWFARGIPVRVKTLLVALGLLIPLGLMGILPADLWVVTDGVVLGTLAGAALWLVTAAVRRFERWPLRAATPWSPSTAAGIAFAILLTASSSAQAQPASPPLEASVPGATTHTAIVPLADVTGSLEGERVFLPMERFLELYRAAHPDRLNQTPPPRQGGLTEAILHVEQVKPPAAEAPAPNATPELRLSARLVYRSFVDGQFLVRVPMNNLAIETATVNGKTVPLVIKDGAPWAVLQEPGWHVVDVRAVLPAGASPTAGQFTLSVEPVPAGRLSFVLPAPNLTARVNGSSTLYRKVTVGERTELQLPLGAGGDVTVSWQPETARGGNGAVVHVDSITAAVLDDAGLRTHTGFEYRVRQGSLADVTWAVPAALTLQSIAGTDVGGWELTGEGDARRVRVFFRRNVTDSTRVNVEAFQPLDFANEPRPAGVPTVAPLGVNHETGMIGVFAPPHLSVRAERTENVSQINAERFTSPIPVPRPGSHPQLAYRFSTRPFAIDLRVARQQSQAQVQAQHGVWIGRRKLQETSRFVYTLTGSPRGTFRFKLPADLLLLKVEAPGLSDWYVTGEGDERVVTVELAQPRTGEVEVILTGSRPRGDAERQVEVRLPQPLEVERLRTQLGLWMEPSETATFDQQPGWRSVDVGGIAPALRGLRPQAAQLLFESAAPEPGPVTISLQEVASDLRANSLTIVTANDAAVGYTFALQWMIERSSADRLTFVTDSLLDGKLDFAGPGLRDVSSQSLPGGKTRWTISLRTPVSGKHVMTAVATLPPAQAEIAVPGILFDDPDKAGEALDGQQHYVMLVNLSLSQLTAREPERTEAVRPEDVPLAMRGELVDQATELVRVKEAGRTLHWRLQQFGGGQSIGASVNVADLSMVIARDGTYRCEAVYTVKNRSRQFLAVVPPPGASLLSVLVADRPARAVSSPASKQGALLVALPKSSAADLSFTVRMMFSGRLGRSLPHRSQWFSREIDLPAPQVVSQADDPLYGIPVARTRWSVYVPEDLEVKAVKNVRRTNLDPASDERSRIVYQSAAVQELSELLSIAETSRNTRLQKTAIDNFRDFQTRNESLFATPSYSEDGPGAANQAVDLKREMDSLQTRLGRLQERVQAADQVNRARGMNLPALADLDDDYSVNTNVDQNGIVIGQSLINSGQLLIDNRASDRLDGTVPEESFEFRSATPRAQVAEPTAVKGGESRQQYQRFNKDQLQKLNEVADAKKSDMQRARRSLEMKSQLSGSQSGAPRKSLPLADESEYAGPRQPASLRLDSGAGGAARGGVDNIEMPLSQFGAVLTPDMGGPSSGPAERMGRGGFDRPQGGGQRYFVAPEDAAAAAEDRYGVSRRSEVEGLAPFASKGWTQSGGLAVITALPFAGRRMTFTKVGGDPHLALVVQPLGAFENGLGLLWSLACVAIAVAIVLTLRSDRFRRHGQSVALAGIIVLAAAGALTLPWIGQVMCWLILLFGVSAALVTVLRRSVRRPPVL